MTPLPLTVIGGYLGAGKTTLINSLLAQPQGKHLMVMVNDFGAINIDESLIAAKDDDVIALTNGCVCCTMGADLFMAIGDALDRKPRPDHLIIEASGIADPKAIANTAIAEPDLHYAGIVTVVDALNIAELLNDPLVGPQVRRQIEVGDLVLQTKASNRRPKVDAAFARHGLDLPSIAEPDVVGLLTLQVEPLDDEPAATPHPSYVAWHRKDQDILSLDSLSQAMQTRPKGLFRLKGFVETEGDLYTIQVVGQYVEIKKTTDKHTAAVVGLGLADTVSRSQIDAWWSRIRRIRSVGAQSAG